MLQDHDDDNDAVSQALELLDDGRVTDALTLLDAAVAEEPDAAGLRALYALILADTGRLGDAERHADIAVALDDELPFAQFAAGEVAFAQERFADAISHAVLAAELSPHDADPLVLEARAHARLGEWTRVRDLAQKAQVLDPGNEGAVMLAAMSDEVATDAPLDDARWQALVAQFPANAFARSGRAWAQLQAGRVGEARKEFEQALALDPSLVWARDGYVASVKAQNPAYRTLFALLRRLQQLDPRTRNFIIIGAIIAYQLLQQLALRQPSLQPVIWPVLGLYLAFVLVTWLADPLLDLALMTRRETRPFLSADAKRGAIHVAGALGAAAIIATFAAVRTWEIGYSVAAGVAFTSFTFTAAFSARTGPLRTRLLRLGWSEVGLLVLAATLPEPWSGISFIAAIVLVVISTWAARLTRR